MRRRARSHAPWLIALACFVGEGSRALVGGDHEIGIFTVEAPHTLWRTDPIRVPDCSVIDSRLEIEVDIGLASGLDTPGGVCRLTAIA